MRGGRPALLALESCINGPFAVTLQGAVPFGPWAMAGTGPDEYRYFGHLPVYYRDSSAPFACCFGLEDVPVSLRGIVKS